MTVTQAPAATNTWDQALTRRALDHVPGGTTDLAARAPIGANDWLYPNLVLARPRHGQHDHLVIDRNEIGVQHLIATLADELDITLG